MYKIIIFLFLALFCSTEYFAQTNQNSVSAQKFTSIYTDLSKDCKSVSTAKEDAVSASGQKAALKCKTVGNYYLYIYNSATSSVIQINNKRDDSAIHLAAQSLSFSTENDKKLEWRLANGKPFAVILRISIYKFPTDLLAGANPFDEKYKTGESFIVKGLLGHEQIEYKLEVDQPNAIEKARQFADEGF